MNEERALKAYEEIMQCTEQAARCVFMYILASDDALEAVEIVRQTSF